METNRHVVLFDGICNLCNGFVDFVIKRDPKAKFKLGAIQSEEGRKLLESLNESKDMSTVIYIHNKKIYRESSAALRILKGLNGLWPLLYVFILIPPFFRDGIYRRIAKNRYKWFGKRDYCRLPEDDLKTRFLG